MAKNGETESASSPGAQLLAAAMEHGGTSPIGDLPTLSGLSDGETASVVDREVRRGTLERLGGYVILTSLGVEVVEAGRGSGEGRDV